MNVTLPTQGTLVNSAAGAAGALAGWAISSMGKRVSTRYFLYLWAAADLILACCDRYAEHNGFGSGRC